MIFFSTRHERPHLAKQVSLLSDHVNDSPLLGLVVQGPLIEEFDFTLETVLLYLKLFQNTHIIVSTWSDENREAVVRMQSAGAKIVLSDKPAYAGISNINFQIASSHAGVALAHELGCAHILKTRTDQRMYAPNVKEFLYSILKTFPLDDLPGLQRQRLVAASLNTFKYRLYGISDMFLFGDAEDMLMYWSPDFDLRPQSEFDEKHRRSILDFCESRLCEVYLATEFLKKIGHTPTFTLADSWKIYAKRFCVIDKESLDLIWPKYNDLEYRWLRYSPHDLEELTFREWLVLRARGNNKLHIPEQYLHPGGRRPLQSGSEHGPQCTLPTDDSANKIEIMRKEITLVSNGHPLSEISVKSLAGYIRQAGISCNVVYLNNVKTLSDKVIKQILGLASNSIMLGLSLMTKDVPALSPLMKAARKQGLSVVAGGIHATAAVADILHYADYACVGEGERPIVELFRHLEEGQSELESIPNIAFMEDGQLHEPISNWSTEALEDLPMPDYALADSYFFTGESIAPIPANTQAKQILLGLDLYLYYSARGCPNSCAYCSNSLYHGIARKTRTKWYRTLPPSRVIAEITQNIGVVPSRIFWFNDDDFMNRPIEELREICDFVRKRLRVRYNINATPTSLTPEKMDVLAKTGLRQVAFGVQSGSDRILKKYYKRAALSDVVARAANVVKKYHKFGVIADYGFILDNPYEDEWDLRETVRLFLRLPQPANISLYTLSFFPGTSLTKRALQDGVISMKDVLSGKDYRDEIRPNFAHTLIEAPYSLGIIDLHDYDYLLSDEIFIASENRFPRMILANYFLSQATRDLASLAEKGKELEAETPKNSLFSNFMTCVRIVSSHYKKPNTVISNKMDILEIIIYQNGLKVTFEAGRIIQIRNNKFSRSYKPCKVASTFMAQDPFAF